MLRGSLEIVEYVSPPASAEAIPPERPVVSEGLWSRFQPQSRLLASCAAALTAIALHVLLVAPVLWAGGASAQRPQRTYRGSTALQWVVLDDSARAASVTSPSLEQPATVAISLTGLLPVMPSVPPPVSSAKDPNPQPDPDSSLGALYGLYVGQIHARIDRAWSRPRTRIGAPLFQCQVQIDQDLLGRVGEVTLVECNGDSRWRLSLVRAVEAASPLPAPPNPAVFTRHVLLEFRAMAYSRGMPVELYQPSPSPGARGGLLEIALRSQDALQKLRQAARSPQSHGVMELRIEGSKVEVEKARKASPDVR